MALEHNDVIEIQNRIIIYYIFFCVDDIDTAPFYRYLYTVVNYFLFIFASSLSLFA